MQIEKLKYRKHMPVKYETLYKSIQTDDILFISFVGNVAESCEDDE